MGEAAGQFAPCGDAFGLHQALALLGELARHFVEGLGELADFIARVNGDARFPAAGGHFARARGKLLDRARDARRNPPAQDQPEQNHAAADQQRQRANEIEHLHQVLARTSDQQHGQQIAVAAGERNGVEIFGDSCRDPKSELISCCCSRRVLCTSVMSGENSSGWPTAPRTSVSAAGT